MKVRDLAQHAAPRRLLGWKKSLEEEAIGGQAGKHQRRKRRRGAGQCRHGDAFGDRRAYQLEAGIGDQRRAGIGDQRDHGARFQLFDQQRPHVLGIVFMIGEAATGEAVAAHQLFRDARILAGDHVRPPPEYRVRAT